MNEKPSDPTPLSRANPAPSRQPGAPQLQRPVFTAFPDSRGPDLTPSNVPPASRIDTPPLRPSALPEPARKPRSDAKLLNLPESQREQLVDWLIDGMSYQEAQKKVAADFGVEVRSLNRFSEFWNAVCLPHILELGKQRLDAAKAQADIALDGAHYFDLATFDFVRQRAYHLASSPASTIEDISRALNLIVQIRKLEHADRKLALVQKRESRAAESAGPKPGPMPAAPAQSPVRSPAAATAALKEAWELLRTSPGHKPNPLERHFARPAEFSAAPPSPAYLTPQP